MRLFLFIIFLILSACTSSEKSLETYMKNKGVSPPHDQTITICHGYGCKFKTSVTFTSTEWNKATAPLAKALPSPEDERRALAETLGRLETLTGTKTGTSIDEAGTFRTLGDFQLDCVDESTNSTSYMLALQKHGLLKHHIVKSPTMRLPLIHAGNWPHQTAVIEEHKTKTPYAVDSWFRDNGFPADIVELKAWKDGWKPKNLDDSWL